MPAVASVTHGDTSYTSSDSSPLAAINVGASGAGRPVLANCIVSYTTRGASDASARAKRYNFTAALSDNGTNLQLTFERYQASDAEDVYIEWVVTEFESSALGAAGIQSGVMVVETVPDTAALGVPVGETEALILTSLEANSLSWHGSSYTVELTTVTTARDQLTFNCDSAGTDDFTIAWQVVEFKAADIVIRHGLNPYTDDGLQSVNATDVVLKTGQLGGNGSGIRVFAMASLNSDTELQFNSNTRGSAVATDISWQCLEFLDSGSFARGIASLADTAATAAPTFTAMDTDYASVLTASGTWPNAYSTDTAADHHSEDIVISQRIHADGDELTITRVGVDGPIDVSWSVVEWASAGGGGGGGGRIMSSIAGRGGLAGIGGIAGIGGGLAG
jgi:hypothetical protein